MYKILLTEGKGRIFVERVVMVVKVVGVVMVIKVLISFVSFNTFNLPPPDRYRDSFHLKKMISSEELIKQISNTIGKTKVLELSRILTEQHFALRDLIDLTFDGDRDIAFRAAWILENIFLQDPTRYESELEYMVSRIKEVTHASCKRHYAKIMMHITAKNTPATIKQKLQELDLEPVVEQCFDWMIDPKVLVAVKVFASEALFNMRRRYPWIKEELAEQIRFLMRDGSTAIQTRGRKLLAQL